jgi:hypothetical protein
MRRPTLAFAVALLAAAIAVTGCGGDDKGKGIPAATATALNTQLDGVKARLAQGSAGACRDILDAPDSRGPNKKNVENLIDEMPDDVDSDVKSALEDSFDHLWDLVQQECDDKASKQDTNTTPADTTPTNTTPTDTTPTDTTPTDTTPTDTTSTSPDEAPLPNDGNGNGNGNGSGGGVGDGGGVSPNAGGEG